MSPRHPALLILLWLTLTASLCESPREPFVLSSDERLRSGSYFLDEDEIAARLDAQGLRVDVQLHDALGLPGQGDIDMSLRDLDERVLARGRARFDSEGALTRVRVLLQPALQIEDPDHAVRLILHARLRINNQDLRFRRSLYAALTAGQGQIWIPSRPYPGGLFPLVVQTRQDQAIRQIELRLGHVMGDVLGSATLTAQGNISLAMQIPDDQPIGEVIIATDPSPEQPGLIGQVAQLDSPASIELWTSCHWCSPGDPLSVVVALRDAQSSPLAQHSGEACLVDSRGVDIICHPLETNAQGMGQQTFFLDAALAPAAMQVRVRFSGSQATALFHVVGTPRPEPAPLDARSFAIDAGFLFFDLCGADPRSDLRWHVELRQNDDDGALMAELEAPVSACPQRIALPLNIESFVVPQHWLLITGIEDGLGRRRASRHWLLPSDSGLVAGLSIPEGLPRDSDVAILVHSRDIQGRGLPAQGQLHVGDRDYAVATDANGRQVLRVHTPDQDRALFQVDLVDTQDRRAQAQRSTDLLPSPILAPKIPLRLHEAGTPIQVEQLPLAPDSLSSTWLSSRGVLLDAQDLGEGQALFAPPAGNAPLTLHLFFAEAGQPLSAWQQTLLQDDAGAQLTVQLPDPQHLRARLQSSDGDDLPATIVLDQNLQRRPSRDRVDISTVRQKLLPDDDEARRAWLSALAPSPAVRPFVTQSTPSASALAGVRARLEQDLNAIAATIRQQIHDGEISAQDLPAWVQRRAQVYYDPWGQPYLLEIQGGRLWLRSGGMDEQRPSDDDVEASLFLHRLGVSPAGVLGPRARTSRWIAAERPGLLTLGDNSALQTLPDLPADTEITAFSSQGLVLSQNHDMHPACTLWAPETLALRYLDQLRLPIAISAPADADIQISARSSSGLSAQLESHSLRSDATGRQTLRLALRLTQRDAQDLEVRAQVAGGSCRRRIPVKVRDDRAERPGEHLVSVRLTDNEPHTFALPPLGERRDSGLHAHLYDSVAAFRLAVARALLQTRAPLLTGVRLQASLLDASSSTWEHIDPLLARLNQAAQSNGDVVRLGQTTPSTDAALTLIEATRAIERRSGLVQPLGQRVLASVLASLDSAGGLTPTGQYGSAQDLGRARLRASARLLAAIGAHCDTTQACPQLRTYVDTQARQDDDVRTLARVIMALHASGASPDRVEELAQALASRQVNDANAWPFGDSGDAQPGADVLATALACHALVLANVAVERLQPAYDLLVSALAPGQRTQTDEVTEAVLRALGDLAEDPEPGLVDLQFAGSTLRLSAGAPGHLTARIGDITPVSLRALQGHPVVVLSVESLHSAQPSGPLTVTLRADAHMNLNVGQPVALPLLIEPRGPATLIEVEEASCLAMALRVDQQLVHSFSGRLQAILRDDPAATVELLILPLCPGQISRPLVWAQDLRQPWLQGRSSPGLLTIMD